MRRWIGSVALALALLLGACSSGQDGTEGDEIVADSTIEPVEAWERVLEAHHRDGGLDYAGLAQDRSDLDAYLERIAGIDPAGWTPEQRVAFWSNAYNAVVAAAVLERYPDLESVKDIPGFFDSARHSVAAEQLTLDEIEGRARELGDPRVHFAVVCASTSCPDLRWEPYRAADLDRQLEDQLQTFLATEAKGMRYESDSNTLYLSPIFKWYAGDFTGGSTVVAFFARGKVLGWLLPHLPEPLQKELGETQPSVRYLDYDWSLNDRP